LFFSAAVRANVALAPPVAVWNQGAMARKAKPPTDRAAEQADYKTWLAAAVAALQREHNVNPSIIPMRVWRHLYIQGRSPQDGADQAAVSAYNTQSAADRALKSQDGESSEH
jgi:hypothetical protein